MEQLPPERHRGVLAYVGGELTFWIVAALIGGAASCAANNLYAASIVFAAIAAGAVFFFIYRAGERAAEQPGPLFCHRCRFYRRPPGVQENNSAI